MSHSFNNVFFNKIVDVAVLAVVCDLVELLIFFPLTLKKFYFRY